ncbi:1,4-alpha-glucan branching enzyme [Clostridium cavendishii DSM 21758]|uniref:1,4-alpha-glucan branching enzyme GlgB n=1 Tax=Clostridium cavendishii DSM 21758 TaxID=1121302 RepID=A0A1M6VFN1_9CLOT|nr:1,4-alpha-glucan branching protein GlgB [Clostridium cavendishii]SHK80258.1 1,4-alpha-glucan branching enzyme [Clostridium cavendishii DSM 21758]
MKEKAKEIIKKELKSDNIKKGNNDTKSKVKKDVLAKGKKQNSKSKLKNPTRNEIKNLCDDITNIHSYLFHEGNHYEAYKFMGAHIEKVDGKNGVTFTTWAPNASSVAVVGDFSNWNVEEKYEMKKITEAGLWNIFIPGLKSGQTYKYSVRSKDGKKRVLKADPYTRESELRPNTASIIATDKNFRWGDKKWLLNREKNSIYKSPINIYEMHLQSWRMKGDEDFYNFREMADMVVEYMKELNYTHIEVMPIMEHPFDDSWGYQATGYYSVTRRLGNKEDFKYFVNTLHKNNIGVILDWVPGHFCKDEHGLYMFDGTPTYEYSDSLKCENKGWGAANFDLGKKEVKSFLISNAVYWLREFHIDGLRVDAVANMLYLNYDRKDGEWKPNKYGGIENLEAVEFFKELNTHIFKDFNNILMIAEESTSWPNVTRPVEASGLGFNFKWNMGWMNDLLKYIQLDPIHRKYHHNQLTFSTMYNHSENFILPISHDEVVHGKKSLVDKMWGDYWNKFAGLRVFIAYMMGHPGKKLLFMGSEFGQFIEWRNREELEWKLIDQYDMHRQTQNFFKRINKFYKENNSLWSGDYEVDGFKWIDADNSNQSILVFMRQGEKKEDTLVFVCNFTSVVYYDFKIGVPYLGEYAEVFNTDSKEFGGSDQVMGETLFSEKGFWHNQKFTLKIKVPPMGCVILKPSVILEDKEEELDSKDESFESEISDLKK